MSGYLANLNHDPFRVEAFYHPGMNYQCVMGPLREINHYQQSIGTHSADDLPTPCSKDC
jgi:hypothetical protein